MEGFSLFKRPAARKIKAVANPLPICLKANEEWALDFMSDALTDGRKFRVFNAIDHYSRFCVISQASTTFPARKAIEYLERAIQLYGKPQRIRTDNGPEFISKRFSAMAKKQKNKMAANTARTSTTKRLYRKIQPNLQRRCTGCKPL